MKEMSVNYADVCYGNLIDGTELFVYFYSRDALLIDLYLSKDATVKEYANWFVELNNYIDVKESYDEEARSIILEYVHDDGEYYCDYIIRNDDALFHVTMCCNKNMRHKYEPIFKKWISDMSLIY